ncbi:hypothetical protein FRC09_003048 [Ceratobasidium sp. 395]|nr:hypothetical protein FRC09_003048 [Ceratobasidium sp. 395]
MQLGRPLSQAKDPSELKAAFVGAIMGQWALANSCVQPRDISINNILLSLPGYEYNSSECDQLGMLGVEKCGWRFQAPDREAIFNDLTAPKYEKTTELKWKFDPGRHFTNLEHVMEEFGPRPSGFLLGLDLANTQPIACAGASDMHTHPTGVLSFMALNLLGGYSKAAEHSYLHDLESLFWVLLYVVAEHREGETIDPQAQYVLSDLSIISRHELYNAKFTLLGEIVERRLNIASFKTSWAVALGPLVYSFALLVKKFSRLDFDSTVDPDACFEDVLDLFLPPGITARSDSKS